MQLSVIAPVLNEEHNLRELYERVRRVLDAVARRGIRGELVLVDDGSDDGSVRLMRELCREDDRVRFRALGKNRGQFTALVEGLDAATGDYVITLDADLQNPPEEIPRVLGALERGYDFVATARSGRVDSFFRRHASRVSNRVSRWIAGSSVRDHGCMLCGYRRSLVDRMLAGRRSMRFITALALRYAERPADLAVAHAARANGESRYGLIALLRLQIDAACSFRRMRRERRREQKRAPQVARLDALAGSTTLQPGLLGPAN